MAAKTPTPIKPSPTARSSGHALKRHLREGLPRSIAEVLLPALSWQTTSERLLINVHSDSWQPTFEQYAHALCKDFASRHGLNLVVSAPRNELPEAQSQDVPSLPRVAMTFGTLLSDPGNQFAYATCRGIAEAPGVLHNPLYLYGPSGTGKSHLLHAVVHDLRSNLGNDSAYLCSGEEFARSVVPLLTDHKEPQQTPPMIAQASLIAIDGIDALSELPVAQEELYLLINRALEWGQQLLLSGSAPAKRIPKLADRLSSRLSWGLSISVDPPVLETRLHLLRRLLGSMADDYPSNELTRMVELHGSTMPLVQKLAAQLINGEKPSTSAPDASFDRIIAVAAKAYKVRSSDVAGKRRQRPFVLARQAALLLGRRLTNHSLVALGGMVGGRDHSTVLHSLQQAEERLHSDPDYAALITRLSQEILDKRTL